MDSVATRGEYAKGILGNTIRTPQKQLLGLRHALGQTLTFAQRLRRSKRHNAPWRGWIYFSKRAGQQNAGIR